LFPSQRRMMRRAVAGGPCIVTEVVAVSNALGHRRPHRRDRCHHERTHARYPSSLAVSVRSSNDT
jgi:hypothetical protein